MTCILPTQKDAASNLGRFNLDGKLTIRYAGQIRHLGVGRRFAGARVRMLVNDREIRVLNLAGQLLGDYTINPNRNYQTRNKT
ncbi:MAG TPA: hypothetical protein VF218_01605 [Acidothermaceae bacterium]